MNFTEKSRMVQSALLLVMAGMMDEKDIPDLWNLRDVVAEILAR